MTPGSEHTMEPPKSPSPMLQTSAERAVSQWRLPITQTNSSKLLQLLLVLWQWVAVVPLHQNSADPEERECLYHDQQLLPFLDEPQFCTGSAGSTSAILQYNGVNPFRDAEIKVQRIARTTVKVQVVYLEQECKRSLDGGSHQPQQHLRSPVPPPSLLLLHMKLPHGVLVLKQPEEAASPTPATNMGWRSPERNSLTPHLTLAGKAEWQFEAPFPKKFWKQ
ncbi:hypothetical protein H920_10606 [Fukomys damarensis]|uniref:Uncharacterized protein n=1 Tax=Fukomys damarensis TaxID=885580 RepID=A0A091DCJ9_FUKDA|nr:hypothetical protein H920_10606 [Fukomys damarensis]